MTKEIELRAHLDERAFSALREEQRRHDRVTEQRRCFIDYSTFLEGIGDRVLDVRIRVTNGQPEIVVKKGQFGGASREEAQLPFAAGELSSALNVMGLLGYSKGVAGGRRIVRSVIGNLEIATQEVLDFSNPETVGDRFIEVEYIGSSDDEAEVVSEIQDFLRDRNIVQFSAEDWNAFVARLNDTLNGVYEHGVTPIEVIEKLGR